MMVDQGWGLEMFGEKDCVIGVCRRRRWAVGKSDVKDDVGESNGGNKAVADHYYQDGRPARTRRPSWERCNTREKMTERQLTEC